MKNYINLILFLSFFISVKASSQATPDRNLKISKMHKDSVVVTYLKRGAWKFPLFSKEWQLCLDSGLAKNNTVAYLWQQKAMPYFKRGKYEVGMSYLDSAVFYDFKSYINYRAFIKCVFQKSYMAAISDFELSMAKGADFYIMDHTREFYLGLCYLQLNNFAKAEIEIKKSIDFQLINHTKDWVSYMDYFYLGICYYELDRIDEALANFDQTLNLYDKFSDAQYYKALLLRQRGNSNEANTLLKESYINNKNGYTINEGNSKYEQYPYQVHPELIGAMFEN